MMLHVASAAEAGISKVMIKTVDTVCFHCQSCGWHLELGSPCITFPYARLDALCQMLLLSCFH